MGARILIAEDDEISRQLFVETLEKEGYDVDRAQSGEEGISLLGDGSYELLIIDVRMPGMDGLELQRRLRAATDPNLRSALARWGKLSPGTAGRFLALNDPMAAGRIAPGNLRYILRAIEILLSTGAPASARARMSPAATTRSPTWRTTPGTVR